MTTSTNLNVTVRNFGPITEGHLQLKPLTLLVGANNSGKSYLTLLAYALSRALFGRRQSVYVGMRSRSIVPFGLRSSGRSAGLQAAVDAWLREADAAEKDWEELTFADLPSSLQQELKLSLQAIAEFATTELTEALQDYYSCTTMIELARLGRQSHPFMIRVGGDDKLPSFLSFRPDRDGDTLTADWSIADPVLSNIPLGELFSEVGVPKELASRETAAVLPAYLWSRFLEASGLYRTAYYLPAARSGILQGLQVFAPMAFEMLSSRFGLEQIEVPPFPGVTGDFLKVLSNRVLTSRRRSEPKFLSALDILEDHMFQGRVSLDSPRSSPYSITYRAGDLRIPIQRASSMVAELAPLDIWIREVLAPGDVLIFDEPEAHLHPENQRRIARVLVRLVNSGVRVICPTHSSLILHQVSNCLLAADRSDVDQQAIGLTEDDLLDAEDVGVYRLDVRMDGTYIETVPIEPGFGISEEEFLRVSEAIGEETYSLSIPE